MSFDLLTPGSFNLSFYLYLGKHFSLLMAVLNNDEEWTPLLTFKVRKQKYEEVTLHPVKSLLTAKFGDFFSTYHFRGT